MNLELRPIVHFTRTESDAIDEARRALYTCQSRGPSILNKHADYLAGWSFGKAAGIHELHGTIAALRHELASWERALGDRKETWKKHPEYKTAWGFRDSQPEHYAEVVKKLRRALHIVENGLAMTRSQPDSARSRAT